MDKKALISSILQDMKSKKSEAPQGLAALAPKGRQAAMEKLLKAFQANDVETSLAAFEELQAIKGLGEE